MSAIHLPKCFRLRIAAVWGAAFTRESAACGERGITGAAYFKFINADGSMEDLCERGFVFELSDPRKIAQARRILSGAESEYVHVAGVIVPRPMPYNPDWSYHLDPASVSFFSAQDSQACDANMYYVEDHIDQVGAAFLPGRRWCPGDSRLVAEVSPAME